MYLIALFMALTACKKENTPPATIASLCGGNFTKTTISFSELNLNQANNPDLYYITLDVSENIDGVSYDINCDGVGDIKFSATADQDWFGNTEIKYGRLFIEPLNSNTFILADSTMDSTFISNSIDTNGVNILENQLQSSYPIIGSTLQQVNQAIYATHYDSTSTLYANDIRWTSSTQTILDYYRRGEDYYFGPDTSGYYHDILSLTEYKLGIVPNYSISYIPVKYIENNGAIKLGYFKLRPSVSFGFSSAGLTGWAVQQ